MTKAELFKGKSEYPLNGFALEERERRGRKTPVLPSFVEFKIFDLG